jgi:phosphoglycerate dehydrogenase-like enzyme
MTSGAKPIDICVREPQYPPGLERLRAMDGARVTCVDVGSDEEAPWQLPADIEKTTQILLSCYLPTNFAHATGLRLLQLGSSGYSQLLGLELPRRNIRACNAAGVFDAPIAEWNVAMMINLARDARGMMRNQQAGVWDRPARFQREIAGSVVGFWGYGGLARETARLCKMMGMTVHVLARTGVKPRPNTYVVPGRGDPDGVLPDRVFTLSDKETFLRGLDFLIVAMPLTGQTQGLIGEAELRQLPQRAFLLNPARGAIVQEQALLRALREGWIAGAALDTHYYYPMPADHPLWRFPNVILTPHISGSTQTQTYAQRVWDIFLNNVARHVADQPLLNELTPAQLNDHS